MRRCLWYWGWSHSLWGTPGSRGGLGQTKHWPLTYWCCWEPWARHKAVWPASPPPGEAPVVNTQWCSYITTVVGFHPFVYMCIFCLHIKKPEGKHWKFENKNLKIRNLSLAEVEEVGVLTKDPCFSVILWIPLSVLSLPTILLQGRDEKQQQICVKR